MSSSPSLNVERVLAVRHWTPELFSFRTTRDQSFRFAPGQFVMLGIEVDERPLLRAYSIASASHDDHLEFFSIKVPDGPLTSRLQHLTTGSEILVGRRTTGTLVLHNLEPGRNLYLLGTGTGLAPFLSLVRDPETYGRYERVILVHSCRRVADLAYARFLSQELANDALVGAEVAEKFAYFPTVTREPFHNSGRLTDLIMDGRLFQQLDVPPLDADEDRVMLCGSQSMLNDVRTILEHRGFREGSQTCPGSYVVERAFVD